MEENNFVTSQDRDDAMAGLLRHNLAGDAGAANDCPGPDILAAYFERSLDAAETARFELHFSQCACCREQLAALARANEVVATAGETSEQTAGASWLWDWRWLAPAAAVLLFAVVWFSRRPVSTPLVAMSQPGKSPMQEPLPQTNAPIPSASPAAKTAPNADKDLNLTRTGDQSAARSSRLKDEESAKNLSLDGRKDVESDALSKAANAPKRDDAASAQNAVVPRSMSETVVVQSEAAAPAVASAAAPPAPETRGAPAAVSGGVTGGVSAGVVTLPESADAEKKQKEGTRTLVQQAQVQTTYQSRALALAADNERSALIQTPDAKIRWRIASGGFVERSEDSGATWQGQLPNANAHLVAGSAPGPKVCWFVGDDGIILMTKDAKSWQTIRPPVRADFTAVTAQDASSATVIAADGRKFTTTDRGKTWTPVP
jgi:hypothetical protein